MIPTAFHPSPTDAPTHLSTGPALPADRTDCWPACKGDLRPHSLRSGWLECPKCGAEYPALMTIGRLPVTED